MHARDISPLFIKSTNNIDVNLGFQSTIVRAILQMNDMEIHKTYSILIIDTLTLLFLPDGLRSKLCFPCQLGDIERTVCNFV